MRKRLYFFILICWLAAVFVLLWYPMFPVPKSITKITFYDKAAHFVFFGVTAYLFLIIGINWKKFRYFWVAAFSFTAVTLINIAGEYIQGFIPGRMPDFLDFAAGLIGTTLALPITYMIHHSPKRKILLHVCCAPCATAVREILESGHKIEFYFYNPNIQPKGEYEKRLEEVKKLARAFNLKLHVGKYDRSGWKKDIASFEAEPEGGQRCRLCFEHRLRATATLADTKKLRIFATTLSISPHKNSSILNDVGDIIGQEQGIEFLNKDFKEDNGWPRSLALSKKFGFYRQKYCGCEYSELARKRLSTMVK